MRQPQEEVKLVLGFMRFYQTSKEGVGHSELGDGVEKA